jgi:hypothetical protein
LALMKNEQSKGNSPLHQTVAEGFEFKSGGKTIAVEFTEQKLSAHAGTATFWAWLRPRGWRQLLARQLPHAPSRSPNHLTAVDKALAFMHGLLGEARKLAHVAYFRRDPLVPELLGIRRVASTATFSRFFTQFDSAGANLRCFGALWRWCLLALPSRREGYTLDLDSTRLLHEDGHQQGVVCGYTRLGIKPCLHPLLAVLAEVRVVAQLWLRAGNAPCGSNAVAFLHQLRAQLPRHVRLRAVRADSGFCLPELLALWESWRLPYVVVAQLSVRVQSLLRREQGWAASEIAGVEVSETTHQGLHWPRARRLILIRQRVAERANASGKKLLEVPGYTFQVLVTSLPASESPLAVWRFYNGRADCENVIKELQSGFALPSLCLQSFWATEAALCLATLTYNLCVLFQRHLGWQQKVTIHTLRFWLFITPGIISHPAGRTTIKLAVPPRERDWWRRLWQKILSPFPNCNAVANRPAFTG